MRESINWFASRMEKELQKHDKKRGPSGWRLEKKSWLLKRLLEEVGELVEVAGREHKASDVIKECADIANFAMMIADNNRID